MTKPDRRDYPETPEVPRGRRRDDERPTRATETGGWSLEGDRVIDQPVGGIGEIPFASMGDLGLDKRKVTQCALSRICGVCGESLARPVAFLGSELEADRNEFHFPPTHVACAERRSSAGGRRTPRRSGHPSTPSSWALVTTSGFEFVRPDSGVDRPTSGVLAQLAAQTAGCPP